MRFRSRAVIAAAGALALVAGLAACSKNEGTSGSNDGAAKTPTGFIDMDPKNSQGPAPEISGAKKGGKVYVYRDVDFEHLDPARNFTLPATAAMELVTRTISMFKEDPATGKMILVGDLAETPPKDLGTDCKQWEVKLKKGQKYEDGSEIKAADINYGIARSFEESLADGAAYIQAWLAGKGAFNEVYKGPYSTGSEKVPGLEVKDDHTLTFTFPTSRCDFPYASTLATTAPVPKAKDTKDKYDDRVFSAGPYKFKSREKDKNLVLEKNPHWDPKSDPIRHQYPDEVHFLMGLTLDQQTQRAMADQGEDAYGVSDNGVPQSLMKTVMTDPKLKERTLNDPSGLVWTLNINNQRVTDPDVRKAIAFALDRQAILTAEGGENIGTLATSYLAPNTIGYKKVEADYFKKPNGDPEAAKKLLNGKKPKLVLLNRNTPQFAPWGDAVKRSLEAAGFEVTITPIDRPKHNPAVKDKANPYDLYFTGWQSDWPAAAAILPPTLDGRTIQPKGNDNSAYFNNEEVNKEMDRLLKMPADKAAPEWAKLDEKLVKDHMPKVPIFVTKNVIVHGSKVGGVFTSDFLGQNVYYNIHQKG